MGRRVKEFLVYWFNSLLAVQEGDARMML